MWEMIKLKIREHSLKYSAIKKAKTSRLEENLEKEINTVNPTWMKKARKIP